MGKALHSTVKESFIAILLFTSLSLIPGAFIFITAQTSAVEIAAGDELDAKAVIKPASGANTADGSVSLIISGGVTPYTIFCIQTEKDGLLHEHLKPGKYVFTVIDAKSTVKVVRVDVGIK